MNLSPLLRDLSCRTKRGAAAREQQSLTPGQEDITKHKQSQGLALSVQCLQAPPPSPRSIARWRFQAFWAHLFAQTQNIFLWQDAARSQDVNLLVQDAELPAAVHGSPPTRGARCACAGRWRLSALSAALGPRTSSPSAPVQATPQQKGSPDLLKEIRPSVACKKKRRGKSDARKVFASPRHASPVDPEDR